MNSKLILKNRVTGKTREVNQNVWEAMMKDGRSKYWSATPVLEKQIEHVPEIKPFSVNVKKEKPIKIKNIIKDIKEVENVEDVKDKPQDIETQDIESKEDEQ